MSFKELQDGHTVFVQQPVSNSYFGAKLIKIMGFHESHTLEATKYIYIHIYYIYTYTLSNL